MVDRVYSEEKARAMAKTVLTKTLGVRPGETVTIETWSGTIPWATAFVLETRRLGARPVLLLEDEDTYWRSVDECDPKLLGTPGRHEWALLEKTNAYVFFWGPSDTARESALPEKLTDALWAYEDKWFATANRVGMRVVRMYLGRTSEASAKRFGVDLNDWREELVNATLVDPAIMHKTGRRIASRFSTGRSVTITHPNGTDLRLQLRHREPRIFDGVLESRGSDSGRLRGHAARLPGHAGLQDTPIPAGNVIVALDESYAEGKIVSNVEEANVDVGPSGGVWEFRNGRLSAHSHRTGGKEFDRRFAEGGKGRDLPGTLSIGINPEISIAPQMRDQALGMISLTIGSNSFYGGSTDAHFFGYLLLRGAEVRIDGKLLAKSGRVT